MKKSTILVNFETIEKVSLLIHLQNLSLSKTVEINSHECFSKFSFSIPEIFLLGRYRIFTTLKYRTIIFLTQNFVSQISKKIK